MPPKHLKSNMKGDFVGLDKVKSKAKPREIDVAVFLDMTRERDRLWWREGKHREYLAVKWGIEK